AVTVFGASLAAHRLSAGLVEEIVIHLVPVLLGDGVRLLSASGLDSVPLDRIVIALSDHRPAVHRSARRLTVLPHKGGVFEGNKKGFVVKAVQFIAMLLFSLVTGVFWGTWFSLSRSIGATRFENSVVRWFGMPRSPGPITSFPAVAVLASE